MNKKSHGAHSTWQSRTCRRGGEVGSCGFPFLSGKLRPNNFPVIRAKFLARNSSASCKLNRSAMLDRNRPSTACPVADGRMRNANISSQLCAGTTFGDVFNQFHAHSLAKRLTFCNSVTHISDISETVLNDYMKDIDQIRRENIALLEREFSSATALAAAVDMQLAQYLNLRDGAKDSKTGKPRGMRKDTAARFEKAGNKYPGWLNIDHSQDDPGDRILSIYDQLSPARRLAAEQALLGFLALENAERANAKEGSK